MDQPHQRTSFWSSLPGILTGSAALITAATGGYLAFGKMPDKASAAAHSPAGVPAEPKLAASGVAAGAEVAGLPARPAVVDPVQATSLSPAPVPPVATAEARPSFNCALASTAVETMVCSDTGLADRDRRVAAQYFALRRTLPGHMRPRLLQSQRHFLDQRSGCPTSECLSDLYDVRLRQLAEFESN